MQQLIFFIQKYKYFLYFLLLQFIAIFLIINNHSFHRSKFISSANTITGGINNKTASIAEYLSLKNHNELLNTENTLLKNKIEQLQNILEKVNTTLKDTVNNYQKYYYIEGKIIANEYTKPYNFITINKGISDSITTEMAVINYKGIIGIVDYTSNSYARVQSILNKNSKINAKFKNNNHFGTLEWDGINYNIVQLKDIPRQANYNVGDTIITGGKSTIFPEGIPIGTIIDKNENASALNTINIQLFNDMSNLKHIQIIKNFDKKEIKNLAKASNE